MEFREFLVEAGFLRSLMNPILGKDYSDLDPFVVDLIQSSSIWEQRFERYVQEFDGDRQKAADQIMRDNRRITQQSQERRYDEPGRYFDPATWPATKERLKKLPRRHRR